MQVNVYFMNAKILAQENEKTSAQSETQATDANVSVSISQPAETDTLVPDWSKQYFLWHREERKDLTPDNWNQKKFLVIECRGICGGASDRLKPIPLFLYFAIKSKRILLIYWEKPAQLEEFLQPRLDSLDWHVPDWLAPKLDIGPHLVGPNDAIALLEEWKESVVVRVWFRQGDGGATFYDQHVPGPSFKEVYSSLWHAIFEPVPAIAEIIKDTMQRLELRPGEYAAAHLRALHAIKSRDKSVIKDWAINAVNCASQLRPGVPIYFASDSKYAAAEVRAYATEHSRKIVTLVREKQPLHIDNFAFHVDDRNWTGHPPSEYYDTFVDLYLLGMSRCISHNVGGFGTWGLFISGNSSCEAEQVNRCDWTDPPTITN
jgi:hypothetical protein